MSKKRIAIVLCLALLLTTLAACASGQKASEADKTDQTSDTQIKEASEDGQQDDAIEEQIDISEPVELKMYLLGDPGQDVDLVYEKISERMKEKINATITVDFLSWAEHDTKYSLLFSSGEDFDIIFTASGWGHYESTAARNGFLELTEEFLAKYAPDILEVVPPIAWDQAKINGKVYMVPNYSIEFGYDVIGVRGDLMEKYGIEKIESKEDLEAYFDAIVENETDISPLATNGGALQYPYLFQADGWQVVRGTPGTLFIYETANPDNTTVEYVVETDRFMEYAKKMKEMADKGYWSRDSLASTDAREDPWILGKAAAMVWHVGAVSNFAQQINEEHPEWKATFVDISPNVKRPVNPYTNNGVAINAASKNPERAMMAINMLMTDKVCYDLAAYGIEGVHYKAIGDDKYMPLEGASRYPANQSGNWGWNNENLKRTLYVENPDPVLIKAEETIERWKNELISNHPLDGFSFNEENVKTEVAVINTVLTQYMTPIDLGFVDDVEAAVEELRTKLKEAGIDKVIEEVERQVNEYLESR